MYLKSNLIYYFFIILFLPILVLSNENEDIKSDILYNGNNNSDNIDFDNYLKRLGYKFKNESY